MSENNLTMMGLKAYLNEDKDFDTQRKIGTNIYILAWVVEIIAALIGLFIAWLTAYAALDRIDNPNFTQTINAATGALPFLLIAIIEPTKIPLANGFYKTKKIQWRLLFLASLTLLTVVTFETMFNGLERNLSNLTSTITDEQNKKTELMERISNNNQQIMEIDSLNQETINNNYQEALDEANQQRNSILSNINNEQINFFNPIDNRISELKIQETGGQVADIESQINDLQSRRQSIYENFNQQRENITKDQDQFIKSIDNQYDPQISSKQEQLNNEFKKQEEANKLCESKKGGLFGGQAKECKDAAIITQQTNRIIEMLNQDISDINNEKSDAIKRNNAIVNQRKDEITNTQNNEIRRIDDLLNSAQSNKQNIIDNNTGKLRAEREDLEQKKTDRINSDEVSKQTAIDSYNNQITNVQLIKDQQEQNLREKEIQISELREENSELQVQISKSNSVIRSQVSDNQVYRIAKLFYGLDDAAEVTTEQLGFVSILWFGSVAFITSTIGTILAIVSFVLRDPDAYKERKRRPVRKQIMVIVLRLSRSLKALTLFILSSTRIMRIFIDTKILRAIRKLFIDLRIYTRSPRIKEVPVEKIVEKIVEKEVPVEKIVEKIVEKEIPVDKIVFRDVEKEVIHKEYVYIPLYSAEQNTIKLDPKVMKDFRKQDTVEEKNQKFKEHKDNDSDHNNETK